MSAPNASSLSSGFISYTADPNYTRTEGFKRFKNLYNKWNAHCTHDDPNAPYLDAITVYNQVKNSGSTEREFKELSFHNFIILGSIASRHKLKHLSLPLIIMPRWIAVLASRTHKTARHWG